MPGSAPTHMAEPFSVFAANFPFLLIEMVKIRQDTPEYSQVFILQKLGFRLYIIFTYFFFYTFTLDDYM